MSLLSKATTCVVNCSGSSGKLMDCGDSLTRRLFTCVLIVLRPGLLLPTSCAPPFPRPIPWWLLFDCALLGQCSAEREAGVKPSRVHIRFKSVVWDTLCFVELPFPRFPGRVGCGWSGPFVFLSQVCFLPFSLCEAKSSRLSEVCSVALLPCLRDVA